MKLVLFVMAVTILAFVAVAQVERAVLVFDGNCISEVTKGPHTRLEFPMIDGKPDKKNGALTGVIVKYNESCGHYEKANRGDGRQ